MDQVQVPVELSLVVQAADDVHFGAAALDCFASAFEHLLVAHDVALGAAEVRAERAEHAAVDADVSRVEMRVDVVVTKVAVDPFAHEVGQLTQVVDRDFRVVHQQAVVKTQPLAGFDLVANRFQFGINRGEHGVIGGERG